MSTTTTPPPTITFDQIKQAISDLEASEGNLETLQGQNTTAQKGLTDATKTASDASAALVTGQADTLNKTKALDGMLQAYAAQLTPTGS